MKLEDLEGEHLLDAVDFCVTDEVLFDDYTVKCNEMRFRLNGKVFSAREEPEDGYRSCMKELSTTSEPMVNTFIPVKVLGKYKRNGFDDILELIDADTKKVVIEVGTEDYDDYYPCYIASFHPENMKINQGDDNANPTIPNKQKLELEG